MGRQKKSVDDFKGGAGCPKLNCAQAIARTYHLDSAPLSEEDLETFRKKGHGKAPGKVCGAYYAAAYLLERSRPELAEDFAAFFAAEAGSLDCRSIRRAKRLSCEGCVALAARYLSQTFPKAI